MRRKRWFVGTVVAAVMVLGITGGAVMAQAATDPDGDSPIRGLASRVAEILGIDETRVQDAIEQAKAEMFSEKLQAKLDKLVESGRLTPEQAVGYKTWIESRPEGFSPKLFGGFGKHRRYGDRGFHRGWGYRGTPTVPAPDATGTTL